MPGACIIVACMQAQDIIEIDKRESRLKRMRRAVLTSARLLRDEPRRGSFRGRWAMLTLTYRPDAEWDRRHVSDLLHHARHWLARRGHKLRYVWVMELTERGAPHYHIAVYLPKGLTLPKPDKQGWWRWGWTRIEWAKHLIGYLAKYISKGSADHEYPKAARISGSGGLSAQARREKRWWLAPSYVREQFGQDADPFRAAGGGWEDRSTGEWVGSQWLLVAIGRRSVRLVRAVARPQLLRVPQC